MPEDRNNGTLLVQLGSFAMCEARLPICLFTRLKYFQLAFPRLQLRFILQQSFSQVLRRHIAYL
jgi:hypothetical protein